jgi:hypothetical protein
MVKHDTGPVVGGSRGPYVQVCLIMSRLQGSLHHGSRKDWTYIVPMPIGFSRFVRSFSWKQSSHSSDRAETHTGASAPWMN